MKYFPQFKKTVIFLLFLFGVCSLLPDIAASQNSEEELRQLFEERDAEIKRLLGPKGSEYSPEQRDRLKDIINGVIDYREMARIALRGVFDTLAAETRDEFTDLFSTIIRDQSLNKLDIYRADVIYNEIEVDNDSAVVNTVARLENVRTPVDYNLKNKKDGWVVVDMVIDDVSTAESYQRQFRNIIRKKGFDSLMETLRKRAGR